MISDDVRFVKSGLAIDANVLSVFVGRECRLQYELEGGGGARFGRQELVAVRRGGRSQRSRAALTNDVDS